MAAINDGVSVGFTMSSVGITVSKFADKINLWDYLIFSDFSISDCFSKVLLCKRGSVESLSVEICLEMESVKCSPSNFRWIFCP
jgi:hypothetical protein